MKKSPDITRLLMDLGTDSPGREQAWDELWKVLHPELRRMAASLMSTERDDHTLQPTALVNEAYLRLVDQRTATWDNRAQFFALAARIMRRVLVDHARRRSRAKRGGGWRRVTILDVADPAQPLTYETLALDRALARLEELDERMARVVELRVFAGMTLEETAGILGVSRRTAAGDWQVALRWLARDISGDEP